MRILFVCNEYPPEPHGGVGTFVQTLAHELSHRGHEVSVVGAYTSVGTNTTEVDKEVKIYKLPRNNKQTRLSLISERWRLARFITGLVKDEKFDLIEVPEGGGWGLFLQFDIPWIIRLHNTAPIFAIQTPKAQRSKLINIIEGLAIRRCHRLVSVSKYMLDASQNLYPFANMKSKNVKVIYNGINTDTFHHIPYEQSSPGFILFAGTLKPMKNIDILLQAFVKVWQENRNATLHIYGKDTKISQQSYWESLTADISPAIMKNITYHGTALHNEMPHHYAKAQVCVFPSMIESFGLVAAEAMACGRPVIYSKNGPGPELINHGLDGYLCDPSDSEDIASLIQHVLNNREEAYSVGKKAVETVAKRFNLTDIVNENITFYRESVNQSARK